MQSPQNPYEQPIPAPATSPIPTGQISLDLISRAWSLISPNLGVWIGATVIYFVINIGFGLLQQNVAGTSENGLPSNWIIYLLMQLLSFVIGSFLFGGLMRMALVQIRTGRVDFGQLMSAGDVLLPLLGAGILTYIALVIGLMLCIVPGILVLVLFSIVTPLIVDHRAGAFGAIQQSFNTTKPHIGTILLLLIVLFVINFAGAIPCGLGLLVTFPLTVVTVAMVYEFLVGSATTAPTNFNQPPSAPIANPNL